MVKNGTQLNFPEGENLVLEDVYQKLKIGLNENILTKEEEKNLNNLLEFEYQHKLATLIPTTATVTQIKEKAFEEVGVSAAGVSAVDTSGAGDSAVGVSAVDDEASEKSNVIMPEFMKLDKETKITNAEKGTLIHLCMQKLDISKNNYSYEEIKNLVDYLYKKNIITQKEAEAININKVYQFTKSFIWKDVVCAKEVQREKPFYIQISAEEVYQDIKEKGVIDEKMLVQGIIDLYYINNKDELILVDFKTDFVKNGNENILINKYKIQLNLYKRALESALNRKVNKTYIYSTYLEKEIEVI